MIKEKLSSAKEYYEKHDTRIGIAAMAFGFIVDSLTLQRIDLLFENLILVSYLVIALSAIIVVNAYESQKLQWKSMKLLRPWFIIPMQYAFGGLFSGFIIFYSRSASFIASWPFLIILGALLLGNEFAKKQYDRFAFQMTVWYGALFSFLIFFVPVLTKEMGAVIFLVSGGISLLVVALILLVLRSNARERFDASRTKVIVSILSTYLVINALYFTNIIPPVPLAMKDAGVFHSIERRDDMYLAKGEAAEWYQFFSITAPTYHRQDNEPVYVYSSIFAPTKFNEQIYHQWQLFDESREDWINRDKLSFSISGGRDGGYRGYTLKANVSPGRWRVLVVTDRGQVLGRIPFIVTGVTAPETLETFEL